MEHENTAEVRSSMPGNLHPTQFSPRERDDINFGLHRLLHAKQRIEQRPTKRRHRALLDAKDALDRTFRAVVANHCRAAVAQVEGMYHDRERRQFLRDRFPMATRICSCGQTEVIPEGEQAFVCDRCGNPITRDNPEPGQDPNRVAAPAGRFEVICPRCNVTNRYPGGFPAGRCGQCDADLSDVVPVTPPPIDADTLARAEIRVRAAAIRSDYPQWGHIQIFGKIRDELRSASAGDRRTLSRPWLQNMPPAVLAAALLAVDLIGPHVLTEPAVSGDLAPGLDAAGRAEEVIRRHVFAVFVERGARWLKFDCDTERAWMWEQFKGEIAIRQGAAPQQTWTPWLAGLHMDDLCAGLNLLESWDWLKGDQPRPPAHTGNNPPANPSRRSTVD